MSAACFALSRRYRLPQVLYDIANDRERPEMTNHQRMGIRLEEAKRWGILYVTNRYQFAHAWFPQAAFDEVVEENGWILARKGDGYLALRSQQPYR